MNTSICIPFKNDYELIDSVVKNLIDTIEGDDYEILVYNDGSVLSSGRPRLLELDYKNTRVINSSVSFGVGYAFDRLAEESRGEYLVLMGSDVYPHKGWHAKVLEHINSSPETIGCSVCIGDKEPFRKYYGADLLIKMGTDDLPANSKLRQRKGGYTDLFRGKWAEKRGNEPYEISCLMGAFYWTSKVHYTHIGGFDTIKGQRYRGISMWGHTEPYLSIKSYLCGGNCVLYPDIQATHLFNRHNRQTKGSKGVRSADTMWWNALFILETMVLSEGRRNMLHDYLNPELNLNKARQIIKRNYKTVEEVREINRLKFKHGIEIFETKFKIKI